jgi:uncharacterized membrane protein YccC
MTEHGVLLVLGLNALAVWRGERMLYFVGALCAILHGFAWAETSWAAGAPVFVLGGYMFFKAAWGFRR